MKVLSDIVRSDPEILGGAPVFVGTRVPVQSFFDYLEGGETLDEFLRQFPSVRRARVIWAGLEDATGGLAGLAGSVGEALEPLGFAREMRAFQPHATIARLKQPAPVELSVTPVPLVFPVERISLFESHLRRPAPVYEELATFPFRRGS